MKKSKYRFKLPIPVEVSESIGMATRQKIHPFIDESTKRTLSWYHVLETRVFKTPLIDITDELFFWYYYPALLKIAERHVSTVGKHLVGVIDADDIVQEIFVVLLTRKAGYRDEKVVKIDENGEVEDEEVVWIKSPDSDPLSCIAVDSPENFIKEFANECRWITHNLLLGKLYQQEVKFKERNNGVGFTINSLDQPDINLEPGNSLSKDVDIFLNNSLRDTSGFIDSIEESPFFEENPLLLKAINELPEKDYALLCEKYIADRTTKELAALYGMKESTLASQINRICSKVKKKSEIY